MIGEWLEFSCILYLLTRHWTVSFSSLSSFWLASKTLFQRLIDRLGVHRYTDSIYGCVPIEKHTWEQCNLLIIILLSHCYTLIYNTHTHTHWVSWYFAPSLSLSFSFCLSVLLTLVYITFQSAKFPWHSRIMCASVCAHTLVLSYNAIMEPTESNYTESIGLAYLLGASLLSITAQGNI